MSLLALAAMALAQPQAHDEPSLEWLVARSDLVVRASVTEVSKELLPKEPFPHDWAWIIVTLKVHETLKGRPPQALQFAERSLTYNMRYEGWKEAGREFLVFLVRNPCYKSIEIRFESRFPFALFAHHHVPWGLIRLGPAVPQEKGWETVPSVLFRNNLDVLEDPADILEAARRAVAAGRGAAGEIRMHALSLPRRVMDWAGRSGDWNFLSVPVDPGLEILAREFIRSPAETLSKRGTRPRSGPASGGWRNTGPEG